MFQVLNNFPYIFPLSFNYQSLYLSFQSAIDIQAVLSLKELVGLSQPTSIQSQIISFSSIISLDRSSLYKRGFETLHLNHAQKIISKPFFQQRNRLAATFEWRVHSQPSSLWKKNKIDIDLSRRKCQSADLWEPSLDLKHWS